MEQRFRDNIKFLATPYGYEANLGKLDKEVLPIYFIKEGKQKYELGILFERDDHFIFEPTDLPSRYEFIEPTLEWLKKVVKNTVL